MQEAAAATTTSLKESDIPLVGKCVHTCVGMQMMRCLTKTLRLPSENRRRIWNLRQSLSYSCGVPGLHDWCWIALVVPIVTCSKQQGVTVLKHLLFARRKEKRAILRATFAWKSGAPLELLVSMTIDAANMWMIYSNWVSLATYLRCVRTGLTLSRTSWGRVAACGDPALSRQLSALWKGRTEPIFVVDKRGR